MTAYKKISLALLCSILVILAMSCSGNSNNPVSNRLSQISPSPAVVANQQYLIGFTTRPGRADEALIKGFGGSVRFAYRIIPALAVTLPDAGVEAMSRQPNVAYIEPDFEAHAVDDTIPWGIARVKAPEVWAIPNTGTGIKLAIVDTGVDYYHPDLAPNYRGGYDYVNNDSDPKDDNGHGTHVAGTALAASDGLNVVGVAPNAALYSVKVLDSAGSGYYSWIIAGIDWSVTNGMKIVSMSLGGSAGSSSLEAACNNAVAAGVIVVAAAGNSGNPDGTGDNVLFPGRYESVICVAATDSNNNRASFSSTGPAVDISAPGVSVLSDAMGGGTSTKSGTSMATPHIAGIVGLIVASGVTAPADVKNLLYSTALDLGAVGLDNLYGYGLADAYAAVTNNAPPPPPPPPPPPSYGTLKGKVYKSNGGPLSNAKVLLDTGQVTYSGPNGSYTLNNVLAGDHNVTASRSNYKPSTLIATITGGSTTTLNFYLVHN